MPEPFTPNNPRSSAKEAPYQIDNIQILSTAADMRRSSAGEGRKNETPWVNASNGFGELQKTCEGNQILVEVSRSAVTRS